MPLNDEKVDKVDFMVTMAVGFNINLPGGFQWKFR